ncbi:Retrovirus-related Pol polyprotein from transposon TNT 1-94 [Cucumis melo var. makuwa]|uniref:Retrovirus-related Pol polyprotein from transposon TNT 1-94 n=1 Tax=Cucumis melo var. makuwa TaxID=1194695 RepID=A0A5D3BLE0_CUCMM|nr:Retrovirus-related Pol polyprotein from transposon TNT 1-94 [Cucumis melo var. makuwa]TYJ99789.1 Retrovirus-related Pol polyprotein from transposon TNT 1-94 [Cucumis melo var. makuwa]
MSDENQVVILLNSLLETYREVKVAIKYGRDSLTMNIVLDALKTRNLEIKKEHKDRELLVAKGRIDKMSWKGKEKSSTRKSKGEGRKCFFCHKEGHFKKHWLLNKSKEASNSKHVVEASLASVTNGRVLLDDNGICDVKETELVQIATHDRMIKKLTNVSYQGFSGQTEGNLDEWSVCVGMYCSFSDNIKAKPLTLKKAIVSDLKKQWKDAMEAELFSLQKNQTWSLVPKPPIRKLIQIKWIDIIKLGGESKLSVRPREQVQRCSSNVFGGSLGRGLVAGLAVVLSCQRTMGFLGFAVSCLTRESRVRGGSFLVGFGSRY